MSLSITSACVNCYACEPLCPSNAITDYKAAGTDVFVIDKSKCTECEGDFADPQCASICPVEGAILDAMGEAINPPGSLTG